MNLTEKKLKESVSKYPPLSEWDLHEIETAVWQSEIGNGPTIYCAYHTHNIASDYEIEHKEGLPSPLFICDECKQAWEESHE